jgi:hypothetical protein
MGVDTVGNDAVVQLVLLVAEHPDKPRVTASRHEQPVSNTQAAHITILTISYNDRLA